MEKYLRGSEWRKWDLHVHSNASDGKLSPDEIIQLAKKEGISVIALTDHHTVANLDETKRLGRENNITVISGIEFRTEYGSKSVHIIGLLPDKYDNTVLNQEAIDQLILSKLNLSKIEIEAKGKEKNSSLEGEDAFKEGMHLVQVDLKTAADLIHKYGGLISVHAGGKQNSIEQMKHEGNGATNVKDVVDSLGPVKTELLQKYIDICEVGNLKDKSKDFYPNEFKMPVIAASDTHDSSRFGKVFTWIKADPTFEGLRQIKYEPYLRVKIQENNPESKPDYQVIDSLEIDNQDFGIQRLVFNSGLNTIIGGKSSGKSILLGAMAKLANYEGDIKDREEYNKYIDDISKTMNLKWRDCNENENRKVEYFPQSYINGLASDSAKTIEIVESILKSDAGRKLAFHSMATYLVKCSLDMNTAIQLYFSLSDRINDINNEIISIGNLESITQEIKKIEEQIDELKKNNRVQLTDEGEEKYKKLKEERRTLQNQKSADLDTIAKLNHAMTLVLFREIGSDLVEVPEELRSQLLNKWSEITNNATTEWNSFIINQIKVIEKNIESITSRIEEIESNSIYLDGEKNYESCEALVDLLQRLDSEKKKEIRIRELSKSRNDNQEEQKKQLRIIFDLKQDYLTKETELSNKVRLEKDEIIVTPKISFNNSLFRFHIENRFDKRNGGIKKYTEYKYENEESHNRMLVSLIQDIQKGVLVPKSSQDKRELITFFLSTIFYMRGYDVEYQGDDLESMSEGKKAFVILKMLLEFSENTCPILIDQPEDDLDNRAIYNELVTYLRKKKMERQIIVVTHNPNIVVGADADEVIVANQNGVQSENRDGVKFMYCSGAIENTFNMDTTYVLEKQGIREHICELLEGGDAAFLKREEKYCLHSKQ